MCAEMYSVVWYNARTTVKLLDCVKKVLVMRCGPDAATWQREMTMKMLMLTALDPDCVNNAARSHCLHFILHIYFIAHNTVSRWTQALHADAEFIMLNLLLRVMYKC